MTLDVRKDQFLPTVLVNEVGECGQCLSEFVRATWIDQSATKLSDSLCATRFYKPDCTVILEGRKGR
jgi:hypothetical protein